MKRTLLGAAIAGLLAIGQAHAAVPANVVQYSPPAPTGPNGSSAATPKMMGIGYAGEFTPHYDGVAIIQVSGTASNNTVSDGATIQVMYGQGAAPANAAAVTGVSCGTPVLVANGSLSGNVSNKFQFSATCVATGLQLNGQYWIDIAAASTVNSTTTTLSNINVIAVEE